MKGHFARIGSLCLAAAMLMQGVSVSAFTDPATIYAQYAQGNTSSSENSASSD